MTYSYVFLSCLALLSAGKSFRVPLTLQQNNDMVSMEQKHAIMGTKGPVLNDIGLDQEKEFENFYMTLLIGPNHSPIKVSFDIEGSDLYVKTD